MARGRREKATAGKYKIPSRWGGVVQGDGIKPKRKVGEGGIRRLQDKVQRRKTHRGEGGSAAERPLIAVQDARKTQ